MSLSKAKGKAKDNWYQNALRDDPDGAEKLREERALAAKQSRAQQKAAREASSASAAAPAVAPTAEAATATSPGFVARNMPRVFGPCAAAADGGAVQRGAFAGARGLRPGPAVTGRAAPGAQGLWAALGPRPRAASSRPCVWVWPAVASGGRAPPRARRRRRPWRLCPPAHGPYAARPLAALAHARHPRRPPPSSHAAALVHPQAASRSRRRRGRPPRSGGAMRARSQGARTGCRWRSSCGRGRRAAGGAAAVCAACGGVSECRRRLLYANIEFRHRLFFTVPSMLSPRARAHASARHLFDLMVGPRPARRLTSHWAPPVRGCARGKNRICADRPERLGRSIGR